MKFKATGFGRKGSFLVLRAEPDVRAHRGERLEGAIVSDAASRTDSREAPIADIVIGKHGP